LKDLFHIKYWEKIRTLNITISEKVEGQKSLEEK
jgi:hypothetical protein